MMKFTKKHYFLFLMFIGVIVGLFLRFYRIRSQIIWDDEWHGIYTAFFNPIKYILTHFHSNDNCIPLTFYFRIMLKSFGLNETIIRLPQLLSGLLTLVIFPLIIKKLFNKKVAIIFLFMLAISPLLIYYSRLSRPYGVVIFLSFISIFSFYFWITEGKSIYAAIYLTSAVLASYFSLSSIASVLAPILYILILFIAKKTKALVNVDKNIPPFRHIAIVSFILVLGISLWLLPAIGTMNEVTSKNVQGFFNLGTFGGCVGLFNGTNSYALSLILIALFFYGSYILYASNKLLFSYLISVSLFQLAFLILTRPFLMQASIIFTRYFISILPIWLLIISIALNKLHIKSTSILQKKTKMANTVSNLMFAVFLLIIFLRGPVSRAYSFPNDFTNHQDFQYNYFKPIPSITDDPGHLCPKFYLSLVNQSNNLTIIEFPAIISWFWNPFHIYQRLHKNRVKVGYSSDSFGPFFGYDNLENQNVKFNNFVDISNPESLQRSEADFIIVHKSIYEESLVTRLNLSKKSQEMASQMIPSYDSTREKLQKYVSKAIINLQEKFSNPVYEDEWIVVYRPT